MKNPMDTVSLSLSRGRDQRGATAMRPHCLASPRVARKMTGSVRKFSAWRAMAEFGRSGFNEIALVLCSKFARHGTSDTRAR